MTNFLLERPPETMSQTLATFAGGSEIKNTDLEGPQFPQSPESKAPEMF